MRPSPKSPSRKPPVERAPCEHSHAYLKTLRLAGHPTLGKGPAPVFVEHLGRLLLSPK